MAKEDGLIDQIDHQVKLWAGRALGACTISLESPDRLPSPGIGLYLLALAENPPLQGAQRAPLQFWLRYLVTAWAETSRQAHAILGELLLAAMDTPSMKSSWIMFLPQSGQVLG